MASFNPGTVLKSALGHRSARWVSTLVLCVLLSTSAVVLGGCNQMARFGIGTTPIEKILSNPSKFSEVTVRGQVVKKLGVLGKGVYEVKDRTGSVFVITGSGMPEMDAQVTVRGRVSEGVSLGGNNFAVTISEEERF